MKDTQLTLKRYEKKYLLTAGQYAGIRRQLDPYIVPDVFFKSTVCSLYYDTDDYELIRRSIDAPVYKEKLRLRSYNVPGPEDTVFVELKKKFKGVVYKRRAAMGARDAAEYLAGGRAAPGDGQVTREIDWFLKTHEVRPRAFIACDREAYAGRGDGELRITFDENIRWRAEELDLTCGDGGESILPQGSVLMEIKLPEAAPLWLAEMLSENRVFPAGFSKYGECYKANLINGVIFSV